MSIFCNFHLLEVSSHLILHLVVLLGNASGYQMGLNFRLVVVVNDFRSYEMADCLFCCTSNWILAHQCQHYDSFELCFAERARLSATLLNSKSIFALNIFRDSKSLFDSKTTIIACYWGRGWLTLSSLSKTFWTVSKAASWYNFSI